MVVFVNHVSTAVNHFNAVFSHFNNAATSAPSSCQPAAALRLLLPIMTVVPCPWAAFATNLCQNVVTRYPWVRIIPFPGHRAAFDS